MNHPPILPDFEDTLHSARSLAGKIRKLQDNLTICGNCQQAGDCHAIREYHLQIDAAILEVSQELDLQSTLMP